MKVIRAGFFLLLDVNDVHRRGCRSRAHVNTALVVPFDIQFFVDKMASTVLNLYIIAR